MNGNQVTAPTYPGVGTVASDVANLAGGQIIQAITNTLPFVLPVLAVLWAIRYTLAKIGLN